MINDIKDNPYDQSWPAYRRYVLALQAAGLPPLSRDQWRDAKDIRQGEIVDREFYFAKAVAFPN